MYTNKLMVENFLKRDLTEDEEAYLMVLIPGVKKWIDGRLDSNFSKVDPTRRFFDAGHCSCDIDPCTGIESIQAIDVYGVVQYTYNPWEYLIEPQNSNVKRELVRRGKVWAGGVGSLAVTAKFSEWDGGVPEDIEIVATRICAGLIRTSVTSLPGGTVEKEMIEGHTIMYSVTQSQLDASAYSDPMVEQIINQRKEILLG